jgi:hypothetical protein
MADSTTILREFLQQDANALVAFLGGNYISNPVAPSGWSNNQKAIVWHEETGDAHETGATQQGTFVFKCYGGSASYTDARAVAGALYSYLHNARGAETTSGRLDAAHLIVRFQGPPEPETGWPVAVAKYRVITS